MGLFPPVLGVANLLDAIGESMSDQPLLWVLVFLNAYFVLLYVLVKTGWLARLNLSLFGPALMLKTERGRGVLDWFARARRTFDGAATFGVAFTYLVMFLMSLLLVAQLWLIFRIPPEAAPSPRLLLGIPGVNPIIPIGYGIFALIFAVVVHEMSHGILARVHNLRVKTMGLLFLVIPIGAFVEPDEDELKAAPRRKRVKVFAAGPTSNLFFAILFALLFSPLLMAAAEPITGAPIAGVEAQEGRPNPACSAGLLPGWVVTDIGADANRSSATRVDTWQDLTRYVNATSAGSTMYVFVRSTAFPDGGSLRACHNETNVAAGVFPVVGARCEDQYGATTCWRDGNETGHPEPLNRTVIGVSPYPVHRIHEILTNPVTDWRDFLTYLSLPFLALQGEFPLAGPFEDFYHVPFEPAVFWPLANVLYWLFWINLMLGLTNALPIVPLDGGHMFRDWVGARVEARDPTVTEQRRETIVRRVSLVVTFSLLLLVLMQFIGPPLAGLFR